MLWQNNGVKMRLTHAALLNDRFACIDRADHGRYHLFTDADGPDADPHDHAEWGFWSRIVSGGYVEHIFNSDGTYEVVTRREGDNFRVEADTVHRIVELLAPETLTHVAPDVNTGNGPAMAYQYREDGIYKRPVFGGDWKKV